MTKLSSLSLIILISFSILSGCNNLDNTKATADKEAGPAITNSLDYDK